MELLCKINDENVQWSCQSVRSSFKREKVSAHGIRWTTCETKETIPYFEQSSSPSCDWIAPVSKIIVAEVSLLVKGLKTPLIEPFSESCCGRHKERKSEKGEQKQSCSLKEINGDTYHRGKPSRSGFPSQKASIPVGNKAASIKANFKRDEIGCILYRLEKGCGIVGIRHYIVNTHQQLMICCYGQAFVHHVLVFSDR